MFRVTAAPLFVLVATAAAPAVAQPAPASQIVRYGDLKLADRADARTLRQRIFAAVMAVCGQPASSDMDDVSDTLQCRRETMKRAHVATIVALDKAQRLATQEAAATKLASR